MSIEDERSYFEAIVKISSLPNGVQMLRHTDIINAKASAVMTHVSLMLAVCVGLFIGFDLHKPNGQFEKIITLLMFVELLSYAVFITVCFALTTIAKIYLIFMK
jgi:hypothetical protein